MVNGEHLIKQFGRIGATLVIQPGRRSGPTVVRRDRVVHSQTVYDLNVVTDKRHGEHFRLLVTPETPDMRVLQANGAARHLLLHVAGQNGGERFLCGHDERHWFAAAVDGRVSSVNEAKRALLPDGLRQLPPSVFVRRHNEVFKRQGEWFFVPVDRDFSADRILHGEPLLRNRTAKPHQCSELVRFGGQRVVLYKGKEYSEQAWAEFLKQDPPPRLVGAVNRLVKNPEVYVRGRVRHPDHATLALDGWHRVYANREMRSENLSFYD